MSEADVVGTIVLTVDGREFDCASVSPKLVTGKKPVATMNRQGRTRKKTKTTSSITLSVEVIIPESGDIDWANIEDGRITIESLDGGHRTTYTGCEATDVSESYKLDGEAMRSIEMFALDKIGEGQAAT
ncbi:hypothetical protein [Psychrobacter sp. JB193]|uniref:hypothetical protein n=1 Tax=Psychrobacter sp. JB193 TaxID=2024406 RepID=UPI000BAADBD7|nr:hypothetical protein [Psychrobacter sp. JB193]PAT63082.1 hypothetical protein CIK80_11045 [Psychrobacter sp. JB193]